MDTLAPATERADHTHGHPAPPRHVSTLLFSKRVLTLSGIREYFMLAFIHVGTRRVFVAPATLHPTEEWCREQAAAFYRHAQASGLPTRFVYHDRDSKYGRSFDAELARHGVKGVYISPKSPNMQAYIERWIQSIQVECLNAFCVLGERHLNYLVAEWLRYYHCLLPQPMVGVEHFRVVKAAVEVPVS